MRTNLISAAICALLLSSCLCLGIQELKPRILQAQVGPIEDPQKNSYAYKGQVDIAPYGLPNWVDVGTFVMGSRADKRIISYWINGDDFRTITGQLCYDIGDIDCRILRATYNMFSQPSTYLGSVRDNTGVYVNQGTWVFPGFAEQKVRRVEFKSYDGGKTYSGWFSDGSYKRYKFRAQALN